MKKIITLSTCILGMASAVLAAEPQLPNVGFEGEWKDCTPWTFYISAAKKGEQSAFVHGKNPEGWTVSHVSGMTSWNQDKANGMGATEVGSKVEGYNSASAVKLINTPNPFMAAQIVPGFITLGTSWSTANPKFGAGGITINNADGGSFGGIEFKGRPSGIEFMYKRSRGEDKPLEKSNVVAYLWKGHWTQKNVPAVVYMTGDPVLVDMVDRDRCVLGYSMDNCQGGEVTKTDDAELIAVLNAEITADASEWKKFSGKFEYKSDATPEMLNVIISAGDYFGGASAVGKDNSIIVDDVKLLYENKEVDKYPGSLTIEMNGGSITPTPVEATIEIEYSGADKCTISLPNFALDLGGGAQTLGDIVVPDVKVTRDSNGATYKGSVKNLSLLDGNIVADAEVNGTIDAAGNAAFKINVMWGTMPIYVTFNGKGKGQSGSISGIDDIEADSDAEPIYYNINGMRVNSENLTPGLYIVRKGTKTSKVLVK